MQQSVNILNNTKIFIQYIKKNKKLTKFYNITGKNYKTNHFNILKYLNKNIKP